MCSYVCRAGCSSSIPLMGFNFLILLQKLDDLFPVVDQVLRPAHVVGEGHASIDAHDAIERGQEVLRRVRPALGPSAYDRFRRRLGPSAARRPLSRANPVGQWSRPEAVMLLPSLGLPTGWASGPFPRKRRRPLSLRPRQPSHRSRYRGRGPDGAIASATEESCPRGCPSYRCCWRPQPAAVLPAAAQRHDPDAGFNQRGEKELDVPGDLPYFSRPRSGCVRGRTPPGLAEATISRAGR